MLSRDWHISVTTKKYDECRDTSQHARYELQCPVFIWDDSWFECEVSRSVKCLCGVTEKKQD